MKIAFFEIQDWEKEFLEKNLAEFELSFYSEPLTEENANLASTADAVSVFIYSKLNSAALEKLPGLKIITTRSMGFDHIDLSFAKSHNITVCRVPAYGEKTVAEHTMGLILALSRKIMAAYEKTEKMIFDYRGLMGFDLAGKTIGIIGGGKIGLNVAKIAKAGFEMNVLVNDANPKPELAAQMGFVYSDLNHLLQNSDIISLHAPYLPSTHHLINSENINLIKKGALLINTARGALVETKAILIALEKGILSGAGLDVLEEEKAIYEESELLNGSMPKNSDLATIIQNHLLIARNDVIITPHIAFNSKEALNKILQTTIENLRSFSQGKAVNVVEIKS